MRFAMIPGTLANLTICRVEKRNLFRIHLLMAKILSVNIKRTAATAIYEEFYVKNP